MLEECSKVKLVRVSCVVTCLGLIRGFIVKSVIVKVWN